ncbi:hypothetical protein BRADI_1g35510v3 [Brachypodium distachyon]|uniref:Uncharacterized protein n=2 Tax=Brachypodium distachyon TaxID=15368 RepID=A0A0Q3JIT4_BRADI|nr:hypothetical protein BRADI_1g35510v3 [Brachypodium distachyon]
MSTRHYKSTVLCCAFSFPFLSVTRQTYQRTVPPLVMRSLKCVSFLLWMVILLATIGSFGTTAHRELLMATRGVETKLELTVEKTNIDEEIRNNVPTVRKMDFGTADANDARSIPSSGDIKNNSTNSCAPSSVIKDSGSSRMKARPSMGSIKLEGSISGQVLNVPNPRHIRILPSRNPSSGSKTELEDSIVPSTLYKNNDDRKHKMLEASDEVLKFLNRDYNRFPRRRTPVHN